MDLSEPGKPLQSFGKVGCELTLPAAIVTVDVDVVNGPLVRSSALCHNTSKTSHFAFEVLLNTHFEDKGQNPELADVNLGLSVSRPSWNVSARTFEFLSAVQVSYLQQYSSTLLVGSQIDYRLKSNGQKISVGANLQ